MGCRMDFYKNLSALRREKGVSQRAVAERLNVSQALLSHYEKGIREPGLEFVSKACDYYGVSADYILGRSDSKDGLSLSAGEFSEGGEAYKKSLLCSLNLLFDLLSESRDENIRREAYISFAVYIYKLFRRVCEAAGVDYGGFELGPRDYPQGADAETALSALRLAKAMSDSELKLKAASFEPLAELIRAVETQIIADTSISPV